MNRRKLAWLCVVAALALCLVGCSQSGGNTGKTDEPVTLVLSGSSKINRGLEALSAKFTKLYPNCKIEYVYLQDYNDSLPKRLASDTDKLDLFFTVNIRTDSPLQPYALELFSQKDKLDLSALHEGMIKNYTYLEKDASGNDLIYSLPAGAELRGMFVNVTLLKSLGISTPSTWAGLLSACETLKQHGYIPLQGNPANFGQQLMYPAAANVVANHPEHEKIFQQVDACEPGAADLFAPVLAKLYTLVENGYYDYKTAQTEYGNFMVSNAEQAALDFFHIKADDSGVYAKVSDVGQVAFMTGAITHDSFMRQIKEDYHSNIEYEFILALVGDESGYAYMSPLSGLAVNNKSDHIDWALRFLNFFYTPENNRQYAADNANIPVTKDALSYITEKFSIPDDHVSHLGQVSFRYTFYEMMADTFLQIAKGNNTKYMQQNADGTYAMYPLSYYQDGLVQKFEKQRLEGSWK